MIDAFNNDEDICKPRASGDDPRGRSQGADRPT